MRLSLLLVVAAAAVVAALTGRAGATTPTPTGFAFGRSGGNIRPFTVRVANSGAVAVSGPVTVARMRVEPTAVVRLNRIATVVQFETLPARRLCPGTLPDIATQFLRVGARTVRVHGGCSPRFQRLWNALSRTVGVSYN